MKCVPYQQNEVYRLFTWEAAQSAKAPYMALAENNIYLAPHPALRPYIANYTITYAQPMAREQAVLPTASNTIVYALWVEGIYGGIRGVNTKTVNIGGYASQFPLLVLVEFHAAGFYPFTGLSQCALLDRSFALADVDSALDAGLVAAIRAADSPAALKHAFDRIFLARLDAAPVHPAIAAALEQIVASHGAISSKAVAQAAHYSAKQLGRLFHTHLGTGVKTFARIVRINHTLRLMAEPTAKPMQLIEQAGYYDGAHLVHDIQAICGITPKEYVDNMSLFYNDTFKLNT